MDELEDYKQQLEGLKALRESLTSVEEREDTRENSTEIRKHMLEELNSIDEAIKQIKSDRKKTAKELEKTHKKMQDAIDARKEAVENTKLLSEEEIIESREEYENSKLKIYEESLEIKKQFDTQTKMIRDLNSKKTRLENSIKSAEALGLTFSEYKEIYSTLSGENLMKRILEKKGLTDIINKPAKERTKEEEDLFKQTKEEVLKELAEMRKKDEHVPILEDGITAIYSLDTTVAKKEEPQKIKIKKNELMVISKNDETYLFSHKVVPSNTYTNTNTLEDAPKDMIGARRNARIDFSKLKPLDEKVTIFKDKDADEYYVRQYALNKLELIPLSREIKIDGSSCYKISESDVEIIKQNGKNKWFPYITDIKEVNLSKDNINNIEVKTEAETTPTTEVKTEAETTPTTEVKAETETTPSTEVKAETETLTPEEVEAAIRAAMKGIKDPNSKPKAKNVKASEKFKLELKEGTVAYNIVHKGIKFVKAICRGIAKAYNNYLFGKEMAAKIDKIEREELGKRHFYDEDDELEDMLDDQQDSPRLSEKMETVIKRAESKGAVSTKISGTYSYITKDDDGNATKADITGSYVEFHSLYDAALNTGAGVKRTYIQDDGTVWSEEDYKRLDSAVQDLCKEKSCFMYKGQEIDMSTAWLIDAVLKDTNAANYYEEATKFDVELQKRIANGMKEEDARDSINAEIAAGAADFGFEDVIISEARAEYRNSNGGENMPNTFKELKTYYGVVRHNELKDMLDNQDSDEDSIGKAK